MSRERIHYDDDPADTAAQRWLRTPVGTAVVGRAALGARSCEQGLRRAFRAGFLIGVKAERDKAAERCGEAAKAAGGER